MTDATQVAGTDVPKFKARWDLLFVVPGKTNAQDGVKEHLETGELFGMYSGDTVDEMKERTGAVLRDADEFIAESEKAMTTDPVEITEEQYEYALEVLPPCDWQHGNGNQSFYMSEFYSGDVTTFYVRLGKCHYSFMAPRGRGETYMSHAKRVKKVMDWLEGRKDG
jgi:hypothetical protein